MGWLFLGIVIGLGIGWLVWAWKPFGPQPPKDKTLADKHRNPQKTMGRGGE
jgi:hypothetical protein